MIIWISSYPKSGNTYLRSFLSSYYYSKDGKFDFNLLLNIGQFPSPRYSDIRSFTYIDGAKNWINNQKKFFTKEKIFFLKTHNSMEEYFGYRFTKSSETLGAIYIVRDPRNVISSMCNHYSMNFNEAYNKMIDQNASLSRKKTDDDITHFSFLGSWSNHYRSWKNNFEFKTLIIKYEDLEKDAYNEFWKILTFIEELTDKKDPINKKKFENSLISTNFSSLKQKEKLHGFKESLSYKNNNKTNFFNLGFENKWQKILPEEISRKIKDKFFDELEELKYE
tara:strand:+ start:1834 stop:2670 length:837 start_codon:yes stop_codon:yes gene_type:complete